MFIAPREKLCHWTKPRISLDPANRSTLPPVLNFKTPSHGGRAGLLEVAELTDVVGCLLGEIDLIIRPEG